MRALAGLLVVAACSDSRPRGVSYASMVSCAGQPNVVYAAGNTASASVAIYRSDDGGGTWRPTAGSWISAYHPQWGGPAYDHRVARLAVSPRNANLVLLATEWG